MYKFQLLIASLKMKNNLNALMTMKDYIHWFSTKNKITKVGGSMNLLRTGLSMMSPLKFLLKMLNYISGTTKDNIMFTLTEKTLKLNVMTLKKTIGIAPRFILNSVILDRSYST
jgi:hypothetical protein